MKKQTFALFFGNRGFMPAELIKQARIDMVKALTDANYDYIIMDEDLTRYGAVETRDEGLLYHQFLKKHEGEFDGVILCMPIFIDENGEAQAGVDLTIDTCDFSITLPIDTRRMTNTKLKELIKQFS